MTKLKLKVAEVRKSKYPYVSQHLLAERAGIDQAALSRIESGRADPKVSTVVKLATALGVPVTALLG